jgi:hypothetical protein
MHRRCTRTHPHALKSPENLRHGKIKIVLVFAFQLAKPMFPDRYFPWLGREISRKS